MTDDQKRRVAAVLLGMASDDPSRYLDQQGFTLYAADCLVTGRLPAKRRILLEIAWWACGCRRPFGCRQGDVLTLDAETLDRVLELIKALFGPSPHDGIEQWLDAYERIVADALPPTETIPASAGRFVG